MILRWTWPRLTNTQRERALWLHSFEIEGVQLKVASKSIYRYPLRIENALLDLYDEAKNGVKFFFIEIQWEREKLKVSD